MIYLKSAFLMVIFVGALLLGFGFHQVYSYGFNYEDSAEMIRYIKSYRIDPDVPKGKYKELDLEKTIQ